MRLLGVSTSTEAKELYACQRHFSPRYRNLRKLSKGAIPDLNLHAPTVGVDSGRLEGQADISEQIIYLGSEDFITVEGHCFSIDDEIELEVPLEETLQPFPIEHPTCSSLGKHNESQLGVRNQETQTEDYLSEESPRKRKYREELDEAKVEIEGLKKVILDKEEEIRNLKSQSLPVLRQVRNCQIDAVCSKMPPHLAACVRGCINNDGRHPNGRRFDRGLKTIALGVRFTSPLAYRYLRPLFHWPSSTTLSNFIKGWPRNPGCSTSSIKSLELRSRGFTREQKFISLCCDEMSLKIHLKYDKNRDLIVGLEDYGDENRTSRTANSVLCMMAQGIGGLRWSQPVAYFFVHNSCKGDVLKKYVFEVIGQLQGIGLKVCQFVSD
ncbi:uncharacterized protein LOC118741457 isoform X1 [Rhagoletis pomonella]|uniref:uncharacterized protein LOC118741457 isoform X1 n=1 Tax=Rhagoletis pomonella TaxID=28610 RepID=UPI00177D1966|nr:uncharacterized protein LOC118741457 isoform X1 [Rhagoletis pomonella]XP_036329326.1 uncharacterized protein LOC118741457 isoform X1 [Rhagoletis pomonella]